MAAKSLIYELERSEWDSRSNDEILTALTDADPLWIEIANCFERNIALLAALPHGQLVVWKLEHFGTATPYQRIPGTKISDYAERLLSLGHHLLPYTFTARNAELLLDEAPALETVGIEVLPVAQKIPSRAASGERLRANLGLERTDTLLGMGGLLHPAKGLDEIADWFLRSDLGPSTHLMCTVIPEDPDLTAQAVRARWESQAGLSASRDLHVHIGDYLQWQWMASFYDAIDIMLVNSISDSWGRMVSEPLGLGVPVLVRRADCGTNHIAPAVVLVDGFRNLSATSFWTAAAEARNRAPGLARFVRDNYSPELVKASMLELLRGRTPEDRLPSFEQLAGSPDSAAVLDTLVDH